MAWSRWTSRSAASVPGQSLQLVEQQVGLARRHTIEVQREQAVAQRVLGRHDGCGHFGRGDEQIQLRSRAERALLDCGLPGTLLDPREFELPDLEPEGASRVKIIESTAG